MSTIVDQDVQARSPHFLIGSLEAKTTFDATCPTAKTIVAYSETLQSWVVLLIRCKRWGCRHCGERKVSHFAWRCMDAAPNRLVTLTISTSLWESPRAAYDGTKRMVTQLAVRLRRKFGEFEYFKVLEVTKKGWPHYHLIVRSEYIPQRRISGVWAELTGATIVDVRQLKKQNDVYFYVMKYLTKQKYIPWTNRRVSWSRNFFPASSFDPPPPLKLKQVGWIDDHPRDVIRRHFLPSWITEYSPDCWKIQENIGCPVGRKLRRKRKRSSEETEEETK